MLLIEDETWRRGAIPLLPSGFFSTFASDKETHLRPRAVRFWWKHFWSRDCDTWHRDPTSWLAGWGRTWSRRRKCSSPSPTCSPEISFSGQVLTLANLGVEPVFWQAVWRGLSWQGSAECPYNKFWWSPLILPVSPISPFRQLWSTITWWSATSLTITTTSVIAYCTCKIIF